MKTTTLAPLVLFFVSIALSGCTTMADAVQARGTGTRVTYQAPFDEVWKVMPEIINAAGLKFVSANREDRSIYAQRGMTAFSFGENVAIFVEKVDETKTSVEIVSKRAMQTNILAPDWAKPLFEEVDKRFTRA